MYRQNSGDNLSTFCIMNCCQKKGFDTSLFSSFLQVSYAKLHDKVNGALTKKSGGQMVLTQQLHKHTVLALKACGNYVLVCKCAHNSDVKIYNTHNMYLYITIWFLVWLTYMYFLILTYHLFNFHFIKSFVFKNTKM